MFENRKFLLHYGSGVGQNEFIMNRGIWIGINKLPSCNLQPVSVLLRSLDKTDHYFLLVF